MLEDSCMWILYYLNMSYPSWDPVFRLTSPFLVDIATKQNTHTKQTDKQTNTKKQNKKRKEQKADNKINCIT